MYCPRVLTPLSKKDHTNFVANGSPPDTEPVTPSENPNYNPNKRQLSQRADSDFGHEGTRIDSPPDTEPVSPSENPNYDSFSRMLSRKRLRQPNFDSKE